MVAEDRRFAARRLLQMILIAVMIAGLGVSTSVSRVDAQTPSASAGTGTGAAPAAAPAAGAPAAPAADAQNVCTGDGCGEHIKELSQGLAFYALLVAVGGIIVSAILWAVGSKGQNPGTELAGKKGMIVCCTAAFLVGALPAWISFLDNAAREADTSGIKQGG